MENPAQPQYEITDADRERIKRIEAAWKAYDGLLDPPLKKMQGEADDNVLSNRCKAVVRRGVSFLFGKEIEINVGEDDPQEAQDFLNDVWGKKEQRIPLLLGLAMNGAIAGCAFLRIVPGSKRGSFRLIGLDPATVFLKTAPQDCQTVSLYCIEYCCKEKINGKPQNAYYREEIARVDPTGQNEKTSWTIQHWTRIGEKGTWQSAGPPIIWAYESPPIHHCQNMVRPNDVWGEPDITADLIGLNNALNLVLSDINRVEKIYGGPILYASGMGDGVVDISVGQIVQLPNSDSKIDSVHITSDVANALMLASDLRSDMDELTSIPGVATGRMKDMPRALSGLAVELLHGPLLSKTEEKKCNYGKLIIDVSEALLVLNEMQEDMELSIAWQSPLPKDDLQDVQAAIAKREIGISNMTLQRELGYDPEEEMELSKTEDAQKLIAYAQGAGLPPAIPGVMPLPGQPKPQAPGTQPVQASPLPAVKSENSHERGTK